MNDDDDVVMFLSGYLESLFGLEFSLEQISRFLDGQRDMRERLGKDDLVEPNIRGLVDKWDKRRGDFELIARDCVESGYGSLMGGIFVNRGDGERYEFCISLKRV